ncbi:FAD-binding domain-containing protein [Pleomassaria siparia CBS 279.74]|uniref:FAD-binding domain-containing protein n=1 Tax=Pleomassaria siparia CBS 279.74 TaxID=1314801 RepID=A0A6G1KM42_9PLEO|nr:FAD-binding domain-containing protein [Pleomassaria siparia CBS 279.74]
MWIFSSAVTCSILVTSALTSALGQTASFEPTDFDLARAFLDNGVDITTIPALQGLATVPALGGLVGRSTNTSTGCSIACSSLQLLFNSTNVINQQSNATYDGYTKSYWSVQQSSVAPYCIFKPSKATEVSIAVLISRLTQCPFAVRSGGHAAFGGASNIQGGITIALEKLNQVTLSADKKTAAVGPGNIWYDVYTRLESQNLTVIGGRVSTIGVGGLTLGGGISFFSNQYGWACDNVISYEVVTASGVIVTASQTSFPDLYWALRGGGNNFGVVTKFTLSTIPQGLMWGGGRLHVETEFPAVIQAFYNLGLDSGRDTAAAQILSFAYAKGTRFASCDLQYAEPVANASIFAEYLAIPNTIMDTTKVRSQADLTAQFNASNPSGLRETYWAVSFKLDKDFTDFIQTTFFAEIAAIADAADLVPAATLQVITEPQIAHMSQRGGNPLGITPASGPLILLNLNTMWSDIADDARIQAANSEIIKKTVAEAGKRGLTNDYIYMNYASQFQAVIPGYGAANQAKLKEIASFYDPTAVFQTLQPGYFKLDGAPDSNTPQDTSGRSNMTNEEIQK